MEVTNYQTNIYPVKEEIKVSKNEKEVKSNTIEGIKEETSIPNQNILDTKQYKSLSFDNSMSFESKINKTKEIKNNPIQDKSLIEDIKKDFQNNIKNLATTNEASFRSILKQSFGSKLSEEKINELVQKAKNGEFPVPENIKFVKPETLQGNLAAYSSSDGGTIFLSESLKDNKALLLHALTEESGHYLDDLIGGEDSEGDEGQIFSNGIQKGEALSQEELAEAKTDRDKGVIEVDGKQVEVEFIAPAVIAAAWWAGKVAVQTAVDGAIDIAIAAISGMPPPGAGAHILNAVWNAIPGLGELDTVKKLKKLKDVIDTAVAGFNRLKNIPGGQRLLDKINDLYHQIDSAISSKNIGLAKDKLSELLNEVSTAQSVIKNLGNTGLRKTAITNTLRTFDSKVIRLGNSNFLLDKRGMEHILSRHHPNFYTAESITTRQTFFDKNMSVEQISEAISSIMVQNRDRLMSIGAGSGQVTGIFNGKRYTLGVTSGRVGQFYPNP